MKRSLTRVLSILLVLAMMVGVVPFALAEGITTPVGGVTVTADKTTVKVGETVTFTAVVQPVEGYDYTIIWNGDASGSNTTAAVTATKEHLEDGISVSAYVVYTNIDTKENTGVESNTVAVAVQPEDPVLVTEITITGGDKVSVGGTLGLSLVVKPENATNNGVTWTSSDQSTATVDANGVVTGVKAGNVTILATAKDGSGVYATKAITVEGGATIVCDDEDVKKGLSVTLNPTMENAPSGAAVSYKYATSGRGLTLSQTSGSYTRVTGSIEGVYTVTITASYKADNKNVTVEKNVTIAVYDDHDIRVTVDPSVKKSFAFKDNDVFSSVKYDNVSWEKDDNMWNILSMPSWEYITLEESSTINAAKVGTLSKTGLINIGVLDDVVFTLNGKTGTQAIGYETTTKNGLLLATGTLYITVGHGTGDLTYKTSNEEKVTFSEDDFEAYWEENAKKSYGDLSYVKFDISSSAPKYGKLRPTATATTSVQKADKYYFDATGSQKDLDKVTYEPDKTRDGYSVEIPFTAYGEDDDEVEGVVTIEVGSGDGDITYKTEKNKKVTFDEDDFEEFWEDNAKNSYGDLSYVEFGVSTSVPKYGKLRPTSTATTSVQKADKYYFEATGSQKDLDKVTYEPQKDKDDYSVEIPFTAYGEDGDKIDGAVVIKIGEVAGEAISSRGVVFGTAKVTEALKDAYEEETGGKLESVEFKLPDVEDGRLYYDFEGILASERVDEDKEYYVKPGSKELDLDKVCFVPAAGASGKITIEYTAYGDKEDYEGELTFNVALKNKSVKFTDVKVGSYDWAADGIDFMYYEGVVKGTNSANTLYSPANNISRGDFMLMLYRAFLQEEYKDYDVKDNFTDVKMGSNDYTKETYQAVGVAKHLGIAKGNSGKFSPAASITREEAMALIYRTLEEMDMELEYSTSKTTSSFTDYNKVSSWAKDSISYLIKHGIVVGNGGKISPASNITRAEMAVILHRVLTY